MAKRKIRGNLGVLLTYLGKLYGNPANAIKEYVSNALDEWTKLKQSERGPCEVQYQLERTKITIDYNSPGMDQNEFEAALNRVADSMKRELTVPQIGELGIGIFAFNQVGRSCSFFSKKAKSSPTIKVVLTSNSEEYEIETATKRESRSNPGMTICITNLYQDPTRPRGSLGPELLKRFFAEKFDSYLRDRNLKLIIKYNGKVDVVQPLEINLRNIGEAFKEVHLTSDWQKKFSCQFWYDPSGKSRVSIRHTGVSIIEDMKSNLVFEESIYASGLVKGYIDADFLKPLPSRTSFEENDDWLRFLVMLDKISPSIEDEIEEIQNEEEEKRLTEVQKQALEISREILNQEQFKDLELLGGLRKRRGPVVNPGLKRKEGKTTGTKSKTRGERPGGVRIAYVEAPFEDGSSRHSEFVAGTVRVNSLNSDYVREQRSSNQARLAYGALMIGKEAIAYTAKQKTTDYFLEKLLAYSFQVKDRVAEKTKRQSENKTGKTKHKRSDAALAPKLF